MPLFEPIFEALNRAEVRYVVVGGVAVVLHGHARLTADLDLAVDLSPEPARRVVDVLASLGLRPAAPVDPAGFADPEIRARWRLDRGMPVFTMRDPDDPLRQVDLFVDEPIPFEGLWSRSETVKLEGSEVRVASIADLIAMKEQAGRPLDHEDIAELRRNPGGTEPVTPAPRRWDRRWEVHRTDHRSAILAGTTPAQRLAWLEQAIAFAARAGALPRREPGGRPRAIGSPGSPRSRRALRPR